MLALVSGGGRSFAGISATAPIRGVLLIDMRVETTQDGAGTLGGAEDALRTVSGWSGLLDLRNPLTEASGLAACARERFQCRQESLPVART